MRITVRIPSEPTFSFRTLRFVVESLTYLAGGATTTDGRGAWLDSYGEMVYNRVYIVETFVPEWMDESETDWEVYHIAREAMEILGGDTVMYTINDKAYFT